jgi:hypothetical protein
MNRWHEHLRERLDGATASGRWTAGRKTALVLLISSGQITQATAMERFGVTGDELDAWQRRYARHGERGLQVTRLQETRP